MKKEKSFLAWNFKFVKEYLEKNKIEYKYRYTLDPKKQKNVLTNSLYEEYVIKEQITNNGFYEFILCRQEREEGNNGL